MSVDSIHPQYEKFENRWKIVKDVVNSDVEQYIPAVDPSDIKRNERYRSDAQLTNFTARTKVGLVGAIFKKEITVLLPDVIAYIEDDATGSNITLNKLAQEVTGDVLETGRYGLLVDYPASEEGLTPDEREALNLKARIYKYPASSIINWQTQIVDGVPILSLVVLKECLQELGTDGFEWVEKKQYRVLRLVDGAYIQTLFDDKLEQIAEYYPRKFDSTYFDELPFVFVGSQDNDSDVDSSPLYDLAMLNIGHLKNSADFEESVHICGQPTLIIQTDLSLDEFKTANPGGVIIGARAGHNLGQNGKAVFLQAAPNQLADEAMKRKEAQALMVGARLVMSNSRNETAEAARIRESGETSMLSTIAHNVEDALNKSCEYVLFFMGDIKFLGDIDITVNDQFFDTTLDPQMLIAQLQLANNGVISKADIRSFLRKYGAIDETRTDEEIDADLQQEIGEMDPLASNAMFSATQPPKETNGALPSPSNNAVDASSNGQSNVGSGAY